ncbi:hypothetical protein MP228_004096 [Amoeboaphelidium protococcarum]|nr:hypothetical protein MP228_004096 [Amoeboaphelidium protococcarum]
MSQHITEQDQPRRDSLLQPMPIINESVNDAEGEEVKQELDQALHQFYNTSQGTLPSLYPRNDRLPRYGAQNINGQAQLPKSPRRLQVPAAAGSVIESRRSSAASQTPQQVYKFSGDQAVVQSHLSQGDLQQQANKTEEQQQIIDWRDDIVVDASHVDPYLQAVASISFNVNVFIFEFLSHLLLPLTFIFNIWTIKGRLYLANRSLLSHKDPGFWIQWISMASLIYIHVLYVAFRPKDFYLAELMLCNVLWLIRFAVISTKYAYVSSVEYKEMSLNVETAMQKSERQIRDKPKLVVEKSALLDAQDQQEAQDSKLPQQGQQSKKISAYDLAKNLISASNNIKSNGYLILTLTLIHCLLPMVGRAVQGQIWCWDYTPEAYVGLSLYVLINLFMVSANINFILIAVLDMHRRLYLAESLNLILQDGYVQIPWPKQNDENPVKQQNNDKDQLQLENYLRLDMNRPENILAWWYLRLVLQDYGMQYYKRINVYSGVFLLYFLALIVIIIFGALTGRSVDYTIVTLAIYNVMLYAIALAQVLFYGQNVNHLRQIHAASVIGKLINLQTIITSYSSKLDRLRNEIAKKAIWLAPLPEYFQRSAEILQVVSIAIQFNNENFTVKILGFKATSDLIQATLALAASGLVAAAQIVFKF